MGYDPNEPRDAEGKWTDAGDAIRKAASDKKPIIKEIEIGDRAQNTITGKIEIVRKIKHGYINGYRADLWILVEAQPDINIQQTQAYQRAKELEKAWSGRMSDEEQAKWEGKLFGTYKK